MVMMLYLVLWRFCSVWMIFFGFLFIFRMRFDLVMSLVLCVCVSMFRECL